MFSDELGRRLPSKTCVPSSPCRTVCAAGWHLNPVCKATTEAGHQPDRSAAPSCSSGSYYASKRRFNKNCVVMPRFYWHVKPHVVGYRPTDTDQAEVPDAFATVAS
jgi:hypothetical protein